MWHLIKYAVKQKYNSLSKAKSALLYRQFHLPDRATCGAVPDFKKSQTGKYSEIRDFVQGEDPLAAQMPIPDKVCD